MSINESRGQKFMNKKKEFCLTQMQKEKKKKNIHVKDMEWRNSDLFSLLKKSEKGKVG